MRIATIGRAIFLWVSPCSRRLWQVKTSVANISVCGQYIVLRSQSRNRRNECDKILLRTNMKAFRSGLSVQRALMSEMKAWLE